MQVHHSVSVGAVPKIPSGPVMISLMDEGIEVLSTATVFAVTATEAFGIG